MKKRVAGLILTGVAATGLGLGAATTAFADPTASPTPGATASADTGSAQSEQRGPGMRGDRGERSAELAKQLAEKLGVDEAKVTSALEELRTERQAQRSQDQQDQAKPDPAARQAEMAKALATKLGVDEAKVTAALDEIHTAEQAEHKTAFTQRLDQAVTDGKLTRAEADAVVKAADAGVIPMGGRGR